MNVYCTYFDHRYVDRGVTMIRSLRRVDPDCRVYVLCLSAECFDVLSELAEPGVALMTLEQFETDNADLLAVKPTRSLLEYYFTLTGALTHHLLQTAAPGAFVTYLDADLMFYSDPGPIFAEMSVGSMGFTPHNFRWRMAKLERYGRYNVGWTSFRADENGIAGAKFWRDRSIEWCHDYVDGDRFADQKYLDQIAASFPGVVEIKTPGVNVAPWNFAHFRMTQAADGKILVDGVNPLVFFHFHGLKPDGGRYFVNHLAYLEGFPAFVRDNLYIPYLKALQRTREEIRRLPGMAARQEAHLGRGSSEDSAAHRKLTSVRARVTRSAAIALGHYLSDADLN